MSRGAAQDHQRIITYIWSVGAPLLLAFGGIGNILCLYVYLSPRLRRRAFSLLACCLAGSDLLALGAGLLRHWLTTLDAATDLRTYSHGACQMHTFFVYFSLQTSAWFLVAITLERFVAIYLPLRKPTWCTYGKCRAYALVIVGVLFALNLHWFFTTAVYRSVDIRKGAALETYLNVTLGLPQARWWSYFNQRVGTPEMENFTVEVCNYHDAHVYFGHTIWPIIDLLVFCIFPSSIIVLCNVLIITRSISVGNIRALLFAQTSNIRRGINSLTVTLVSLSFMYLVCTLPISIFQALEERLFADNALTAVEITQLSQLFTFIQYISSGLNFYVYCATRRDFRHQLLRLCRRRPRSAPLPRGANSRLAGRVVYRRHSLGAQPAAIGGAGSPRSLMSPLPRVNSTGKLGRGGSKQRRRSASVVVYPPEPSPDRRNTDSLTPVEMQRLLTSPPGSAKSQNIPKLLDCQTLSNIQTKTTHLDSSNTFS